MDNGHELRESVKQIIEDGNIPSRVTNQLLMGMLVEVWEKVDRGASRQRVLTEKVDALESKASVNPSITWLLKNKPKETIKVVVAVFMALFLIVSVVHPIQGFVFELLNLPSGVIP